MTPPQFDWRDLAETVVADTRPSAVVHPDRRVLAAAAADPATKYKPTERTAVEREILRLHRTGLQPRDLATLFGLSDGEVLALIHGTDTPGTA